MGGDTTIRVSRDTWRRLTDRKEPGISYDDVIEGLLDRDEATPKADA